MDAENPGHAPHREGGMDAHGYGALMELSSERPLPPEAIDELLRRIVTEIGERCLREGARAIGHIKCYLRAEGGYAKADIVRMKQGAYSEISLREPISKGTLVINSILLGIPQADIERITMRSIEGLLRDYGISSVINPDEGKSC